MKRFFIHPGITPTVSFTGEWDVKPYTTNQLYRLLPRPTDTGHRLRQTAHNLTLPSDVGSTAEQNFILRMLFTDMY